MADQLIKLKRNITNTTVPTTFSLFINGKQW